MAVEPDSFLESLGFEDNGQNGVEVVAHQFLAFLLAGGGQELVFLFGAEADMVRYVEDAIIGGQLEQQLTQAQGFVELANLLGDDFA